MKTLRDYIPLFAVLVLGCLFMLYRWHKVQVYYGAIVIAATDELKEGDLLTAKHYLSYLESSPGAEAHAAELSATISEFEQSSKEMKERIAPYVNEGDHESALSILSADTLLSESGRQAIRQYIYNDWGWIVVGANPSGSFDLYAIRPDGSEVWQLTSSVMEEMNHDISPDGRLAAYARILSEQQPDRVIEVLDLETGTARLMPVKGVTLLDPAFSPDGTLLAFISGVASYSYLNTFDLKKGIEDRITRGPAVNQPAWLPDGESLVFEGIPADVPMPRIQIVQVNADGSSPRLLTSFERSGARDPAVSPDGKRFAFRYDDRIFVSSFGENAQCVSDPEFFALHPCFSPSSRYISYAASIDSVRRLVVQDLRTGKTRYFEPFGRAVQFPVWVRKLTIPPGAKMIGRLKLSQ